MKSKQQTLELIEGKNPMLVEGMDAYRFFIQACQAYHLENIQVIDFGGNEELKEKLKRVKKLPGFTKVRAVAIVRDAETDADAAIRSIEGALKANAFCVPPEPFEGAVGNPSIIYGILPGLQIERTWQNGTLEDLCLKTVDQDALFKGVDAYLSYADGLEHLTHRHKSRLHTYLSGKNDYVGMKIGEAAKAGAWDWNSEYLEPFHQMMLWLERQIDEVQG